MSSHGACRRLGADPDFPEPYLNNRIRAEIEPLTRSQGTREKVSNSYRYRLYIHDRT